MSWLRWMRCFMCSVLLCSSFQYQGTDGNKTIPPFNYNCACTDHDGIYNLAPLQRNDGKPRFTAPGSGEWEYSYNPCSSFSLGETGNCFGDDVAMCMWTENRASFQVIGSQSKFFCGYDRQLKKPQLEYTNQQFPGWKVTIKLQCNPRLKTKEKARFEVYNHEDLKNPRTFILTHKCACPNGCREDPSTTKSTSTNIEATVTPAPSSQKELMEKIVFPLGAVVVILAIVGFVLIIRWYRRKIRNNDNPRRHLLDQGGGEAQSGSDTFVNPIG